MTSASSGRMFDDDGGATVPHRVALLSIVGFWSFYFVVATLRVMVENEAGQWLTLLARTAVTTASILATVGLYLVLRQSAGRSIARDIGLAMLVSVPAAAVYGIVSWLMFDRALPAWRVAANRATGAVVVGAPAMDTAVTPLAGMVEIALNGFFFFVGWCALYLALSHAARTRALEQAAARLRATAQAAELRALRYQINPHFLFNTLNSLSSLVLSRNNAAAERMIEGLAGFLRASLTDDPTHDVTLAEEIGLQRLYLDIETERFRERVHVLIDLPPALATARVPGLILQPLVENAVKHGVAKLRRPVTIIIVAAEVEGRLRLSVDDNGTAVPAETTAGGLGLANVRDRIAARFGAHGRMTWRSKPDGGFAVVLDLPLVRDDED